MNQKIEILIGIGSNTEPGIHLPKARALLLDILPDIRFSSVQCTEPIGMRLNPALFSNQLAWATTSFSIEELKRQFKEIERSCHRAPEDKAQEIIRLDLDLLSYDHQPLKPEELNHPYYQKALQELIGHSSQNRRQ